MLWGGRWEGGSCLGTHVRMKDFKIKKNKKIKFKKKEKEKELYDSRYFSQIITGIHNKLPIMIIHFYSYFLK